MDLALNNLQRLICHKTQITSQLYIHVYGVGNNFSNIYADNYSITIIILKNKQVIFNFAN